MDPLFERHSLSKLIQKEINFKKEIDKLNRSISLNRTALINNNLLKQKAPDSDGFAGLFYQIFKEEIV